MNWYRKANNNEYFGNQFFNEYDSWQYPFNKVKKDNQGWYIDWYEFQGGIPNIEDIESGHKISDHAVNTTPYWEVNWVDSEGGKIYLTPIEPNPFVTGVGAGGKTITEHDMDVHTGEYEKERINQVLDAYNKGLILDAYDFTYLLKGTVPVQMGPNGAQGGWYAPTDVYANRGGQEGLNAEQIMMQDAQKLKNMGFVVPHKAIAGELNPRDWADYLKGDASDLNENYESENEDYDNPEVTAKFVLHHDSPRVKIRNLAVLDNIVNPKPTRHKLKELYDKYGNYDEAYEEYNELLEQYNSGQNISERAKNILHKVLLEIPNMSHPTSEQIGLDVYWKLKENAVFIAGRYGWVDVLEEFENSEDYSVRDAVATQYGKMGNKDGLLRMRVNEDDERVLGIINWKLEDLEK